MTELVWILFLLWYFMSLALLLKTSVYNKAYSYPSPIQFLTTISRKRWPNAFQQQRKSHPNSYNTLISKTNLFILQLPRKHLQKGSFHHSFMQHIYIYWSPPACQTCTRHWAYWHKHNLCPPEAYILVREKGWQTSIHIINKPTNRLISKFYSGYKSGHWQIGEFPARESHNPVYIVNIPFLAPV